MVQLKANDCDLGQTTESPWGSVYVSVKEPWSSNLAAQGMGPHTNVLI